MKNFAMFLTLFCMAALANDATAQVPAGFVKGAVTLSNGTVVTGYIKESIRKNAALHFTENGSSKKQYEGSDINAALVDTVQYLCIKGDFFKTICSGRICLLQKASNAAGKASYNGADAVFTSGTDGKIGDYFVFSNNELIHLTKKTMSHFIETSLAACAPAVEKAKTANGDITLLAEAVTVYNNSVK